MATRYAVKGYSMGPFHRVNSRGKTLCGHVAKGGKWRAMDGLVVPTGARFCKRCSRK